MYRIYKELYFFCPRIMGKVVDLLLSLVCVFCLYLLDYKNIASKDSCTSKSQTT